MKEFSEALQADGFRPEVLLGQVMQQEGSIRPSGGLLLGRQQPNM